MKFTFTLILFTLLVLTGSSTAFSQATRWRQQSSFPGGGRTGAFSFSIGNKIYLGGGSANGIVRSDFWEFDPAANKWTRKADFGGGKRYLAIAFSIGNKGYVGTGAVDDKANVLSKDFWEYNPATNKWTRKADFGGGVRQQAFSAATATMGYAGTGLSSKSPTAVERDFWEYNPSTNKWRKRDNLGFFGRVGAVAFAINGKVYAGTGVNNLAQVQRDFYEFNPANNRWRRKASYGGTAVIRAVGFAIGNVGYIGTGVDENQNYHADFWSYNVTSNKWTKVPNLPGKARGGATSASNSNAGFVLTGFNGASLADVWRLEKAPATLVTNAEENEKLAAQPDAIAPVRIAPNPATTQFTISMNKGVETARTVILVYTMQGTLAKKYDLGNISGNFTKTVDVTSLEAGMYKVVIEHGSLRETSSLLIAR